MKRIILNCAALSLLILLAVGCAAPPPANPPKPPAALVAPAHFFNRLFTRNNGGWTGGDGTYSILLPDGRTLWLFGDSFLGPVMPDRSRSRNAPFVRNMLVIQDRSGLTSLYGDAGGRPAAFFVPTDPSCWYWPGDGIYEGGHLSIFLHRICPTGSGMWDWQWVGTDIATVRVPGFEQVSVQPVPADNGVMYGAALLEAERYTYIFGVEDRESEKHAHLARVAAGKLTSPWEYYRWNGWSNNPENTRRLLSGVANQFSVFTEENRYWLVSMDTRRPFSRKITVFSTFAVQGPWERELTVYTVPETGEGVAAYNALAHPQFREKGRLLISYNLNHVSDSDAVFRDADLYRPYFLWLDIQAVVARVARKKSSGAGGLGGGRFHFIIGF